MRERSVRARIARHVALTACMLMLALPEGALGQLRPLDDSEWRLFEGAGTLSAQAGASWLSGQRASLAGTQGELWEVGTFALAWKTGRVVLEAAGTAQRFFRDDERFAAAYADVVTPGDGKRHDSGDYRVSTTVRISPDAWPASVALRFGTRLPTTDNRVGLDRDAIDFFATLGGRFVTGALAVSGEAGLGIHTTRETNFEQDDLFLYSLRAAPHGWLIAPSVGIVGQKHGNSHSPIRGVEDLGELRIGVRAGNRRWIRVEAVKGYETFSPSQGVIVTAGFLR